jgi:hypothetical protein
MGRGPPTSRIRWLPGALGLHPGGRRLARGGAAAASVASWASPSQAAGGRPPRLPEPCGQSAVAQGMRRSTGLCHWLLRWSHRWACPLRCRLWRRCAHPLSGRPSRAWALAAAGQRACVVTHAINTQSTPCGARVLGQARAVRKYRHSLPLGIQYRLSRGQFPSEQLAKRTCLALQLRGTIIYLFYRALGEAGVHAVRPPPKLPRDLHRPHGQTRALPVAVLRYLLVRLRVSARTSPCEHNPAPSPSGHPLLSGPPTFRPLNIHVTQQCVRTFPKSTTRIRFIDGSG